MERPSHINISSHQSLLQRLPVLGLAISLQIAIAWLFTAGLVSHVIRITEHIIDVAPIKPTETPTAPPPEPVLRNPPPVIVDTPQFNYLPQNIDRNTITATATPTNNGTASNAVPERAPVGIASTHTTPPYPVVARRAGWEGNVTLRLTVLASGRVGKAEVITSSGREILDEAAQAWIVGHWAYKPGLKDGVPAISQATALVTFSLENSR